MARILVLGGYGVFGGRAALRLARDPALTLIVAGRDRAKAEAECALLRQAGAAHLEAASLDAFTIGAADLRRLRVDIVINTVGPYQAHDYRVARAAIAAGAHYLDLADARAFVTGITALHAEAEAADVLVVSGASSVPALAAAVIDDLAPRLGRLERLTYGISPGNSFDPGEATVASILGAVGKPFWGLCEGRMAAQYGWQPLVRHQTPELGTRWLGAFDVPDLDLFPVRYPTLKSQRFLAGVEVKLFHGGLWALSWLVRGGLLGGVARYAGGLLSIKRRLGWLGSDRGLMFVTLEGLDRDGQATRLSWNLIAFEGHGPFIPATPAVILARALAAGHLQRRGAMPCVGLMTLADFNREVADLDIRQTIT
ncbi:MAG: saccharopine dehydrogenase family protein [Hyphomicrobiaceae bacterium]